MITMQDNRGAVQFGDVLITIAVLVTIVVLAPTIYSFNDMITAEADPLTALLLSLVVPLLLLSLIISVGTSSRSGP